MSDSKVVLVKSAPAEDNLDHLPSVLTTTRLFVSLSIVLLAVSIILMYRFTEGFFGWSVQHYILWGLMLTLLIVVGFSHAKVYKNKRMEYF